MKKLTLIIMLCVGAYIYYNNKVKAEGPIKQELAEQAPQHRAPIVIEGSPLDHCKMRGQSYLSRAVKMV